MKLTRENLNKLIKETIEDYLEKYYPNNSYRDVLTAFCRDAHEQLYDTELPEEELVNSSTSEIKKLANEYEQELKDSGMLEEGEISKKIKSFYPDDYSEHEALFDYYSDTYKEFYGFRPKFESKPSLEKLEDLVKNVEVELEREMTEKQDEETIFDKLPTKVFDDIVEKLQVEQRKKGKLGNIDMIEIIMNNYPKLSYDIAREITDYILINKIGGLYEDIVGGTGGLSPISGGPVLAEKEYLNGEKEEGYAEGMKEASLTLKSLAEKVEDSKIKNMLMSISRNFEGKASKAKAKSFKMKNVTR